MKKVSIRERGLVGTFFYSGTPLSAIIILGGSSGGMRESRAEELAAHGFASLALAYFGSESLPPTLSRVPLEYFETAMGWLRQGPGIQRIGLWGGSRGAELSLILGTLFPQEIQAIAAHVPSSVVYGDFNSQAEPAWTYGGKPFLPSAPFVSPLFSDPTRGQNEKTPIAATPYFLTGMKDQEAFAQSAIPVEKICCPLLLISAQDDQMWPSSVFAQQIVDRLVAHRSAIPCTHLSYPGAGHSPSQGEVGLHPVMKRWFSYGGNPKDNAFAVRDWWEQTVQFFRGRL